MGSARCGDPLQSEVALDLLPDTRLPAVYIQLVRVEYGHRHRRVCADDLIGRNIFRAQLKAAFSRFRRFGEPVDFQTQIGKNVIINDIVKEHGVRVERFLVQYDAVVECFVVADEPVPGRNLMLYFTKDDLAKM